MGQKGVYERERGERDQHGDGNYRVARAYDQLRNPQTRAEHRRDSPEERGQKANEE